jgi:hypothetical protein
MFCKRISTQASPVVKFPTYKLQIESKDKHDTQTRPSMGNDKRPVPIAVAESQECKLQQEQQQHENKKSVNKQEASMNQ